MDFTQSKGSSLKDVPHFLSIGGQVLDLSQHAIVVGILNVTPDSFSDGGRFFDSGKAIEHGLQMVADGAAIIEVGGESTRPGAEPVPVDEECRRILPVIRALANHTTAFLSVDTRKAAVAEAALEAGVHMINDVSGLRFDPHMAQVAARSGAAVTIMHMRGTPQDMQQHCQYQDVVHEVCHELQASVHMALDAGVDPDRIVVDPGFGFAKTWEQNLELLRRLGELRSLGRPIMVGTSRKSMIRRIVGDDSHALLIGTAATLVLAIQAGARLLRVHDVKEAVMVTKVCEAVERDA